MNIGIDIDDTISNTFESASYYAKKYVKDVLKRQPIVDMSKVKDHYYIRDMFGLTDDEATDFWKIYYESIVGDVNPKLSSAKVINKLKEDGNKIIIITARWSDEQIDAFKISEEWFKKHGINYDKLYVGMESKVEVALDEKIDVFIDDSIKNCENVSAAGIKTYLFDSETNRHVNLGEKIDRVYSWDEIYKKLNNVI